MYLVSKGVPYKTAMHMSPARRMAHVVTFASFDGRRWNWTTHAWEDAK